MSREPETEKRPTQDKRKGSGKREEVSLSNGMRTRTRAEPFSIVRKRMIPPHPCAWRVVKEYRVILFSIGEHNSQC